MDFSVVQRAADGLREHHRNVIPQNRKSARPRLDRLGTCVRLSGTVMFGVETITDEMVGSAAAGSKPDRERILEALSMQVRAMITARLAPTPAQLHAVDDLCQQALAAVSEGLGRLRIPTAVALRSFTSTIVARRVADFLERGAGAKGRGVRSLDSSVHDASASGALRDFLSAGGLSPLSAIARAEDVEHVLGALGGLEPKYREIITLAFFDQLPVLEISERLNLSRSAASMLLVRAVKTLRRNITGSSRIQNHHDDQ